MLPNYFQSYQNYNYPNYTPYSNNYNIPVQQNNQQQNNQQPLITQYNCLNGKIVDGLDVVKGYDVPFGTTYIFPKADGTSIFSKGWLENGTTYIREYKIVEEQKNEINDFNIFNERLSNIETMIETLNNKMDSIQNSSSEYIPINKRKKVNEDAT